LALRWAAAVNRVTLNVSRIIPGDWGKVESGWLAQPLFKPDREVRREAGFTSSSGGVRASSVHAKKELCGKE
jgi:hypothetical protein